MVIEISNINNLYYIINQGNYLIIKKKKFFHFINFIKLVISNLIPYENKKKKKKKKKKKCNLLYQDQDK